ncbi:unnamed protein product [Dicrocoelium dendriticum]|nr:unnamed protein product [Dicrocoelium dendriticum]
MQKRRKGLKKESESREQKVLPVYCICRSSDGDRFMIACDRCEEWYHGDCINVTPKQAEQIKTFFCHQCRRKDTSLEIEYISSRTQRTKSRRPMSPSSSGSAYADQPSPKTSKPKRFSTTSSVASAPVEAPNTKVKRTCASPTPSNSEKKPPPPDPKVSPASIIDSYDESSEHTFPMGYYSRNVWSRDCEQPVYESDSLSLGRIQSSNKNRATSPRNRCCGSCSGCLRLEDCGKCDYCRDRRKFGGPNRMRQKCRLRQCTGSVAPSRHRGPINAHNSGSRRRKQQTLHGVLLGDESPRMRQYIDHDEEPFEMPTDFLPRPYSDHGTPFLCNQHATSEDATIGSKVRRLERRLSAVHELDPLSRPYHRQSLDAAGDAMDLLEDDSDDDVIISSLPHCAGPTCMLAPIPGERYCSEACRLKHANSRSGGYRAAPRLLGSQSHEVAIPYTLPYPDHMYCRHHRVYNWHSNGSIAPNTTFRAVGQPFDTHYSVSDAHLHESLQPSRSRPFTYSTPGQVHHLNHRMQTHRPHSAVLSINSRLGLETPDRALICDPNDTAAFIDSMDSVMRRSVVDELDIDLPQHAQVSSTHMSPSSGLNDINLYYTTGRGGLDVMRPSVDLHHVADVDDSLQSEGDDDGMNGDAAESHPRNQYYYMMTYHNNANCHGSRVPLDSSSAPNDRRIDTSFSRSRGSNRLLLPDGIDDPSGLSSSVSSVRALGVPSTMIRPGSLSASNSSMAVNSCMDSNSSVVAVATASSRVAQLPPQSISSYLPGPDEFYTINDSDDLEINWPQETVAGLHG